MQQREAQYLDLHPEQIPDPCVHKNFAVAKDTADSTMAGKAASIKTQSVRVQDPDQRARRRLTVREGTGICFAERLA